MDPLAEKYPSLSPYVYAANNPLRFIDLDGRILRDANGKIIFKPTGNPVQVAHPSNPKAGVSVQFGNIFADDGTKIDAFKNLSTSRGFDTDCHGVTFADREHWVNNDQVNSILKGDNYQQKSSPQVGDVVVYRDKNGNVVHTVTVVEVNSETGEVTVSGLGGMETEVHQDNVKDAWPDPDAKIEYYKKEKKEEKKQEGS